MTAEKEVPRALSCVPVSLTVQYHYTIALIVTQSSIRL